MKAIRCANGHWYDSEMYDKCPYCGYSDSANEQQPAANNKAGKKGFSLFKKAPKSEPIAIPSVPQKKTVPLGDSNFVTSKTHTAVTERFFEGVDDDKTVSMFSADGEIKEDFMTPAMELQNAQQSSPSDLSDDIEKVESEPLADAVQRISTMDEGRTLSYFDAMMAQKEPTPESKNIPKTAEPVVGWLVAISGVHFGESFQIYVGKNTIGRSTSNKIVLSLDQSISRENHATIIYEPRKKEFYLQSGNTDSLIYVNDAFISGLQLINAKDVLDFGSSKFILIPLCGNDFSWEEYM